MRNSVFITEHLSSIISSTKANRAWVFIYFRYTDTEEGPTMQKVLASVLVQLLRQRQASQLSQGLLETFQNSKTSGSRLSPEQLERLIKDEIRDFESVFFVVDGLDNCSDDSSTGIRGSVIDFLTNLPEQCKALVTSRSGMSAGKHFISSPQIKIKANPADIRLYIDSRVNADYDLQQRVKQGVESYPGFRDNMHSTIIDKAQGL